MFVDRKKNFRLNTKNHSTIKKQIQTIKNDESTNCCQNSFDLTYNLDEKNSKENEKLNDGDGWNYIHKPGQILHGGSSSVEGSDTLSGALFGIGVHNDLLNQDYDDRADPVGQTEGLNQYYSPTYGTYYGTHPIAEPDGGSPVVVSNTQQPTMSIRPTSMVVVENSTPPNIFVPQNMVLQYMDRINWRKLALLALSKLGMFQINAVIFLKLLLLLSFKVKFFLIFIFFKFILLLKFLTFFKLQTLPLLFFPLLPIVTYLMSPTTIGLLIPGWIKSNVELLNKTDSPKSLFLPNTLVNSRSETDTIDHSRNVKNSFFRQRMLRMATSPTFVRFSVLELQLLKIISDTVVKYSPLNEWLYNSIKLLSKILNYFQKVLDSKNCFKRIACKIAILRKKSRKMLLWNNDW